MFVHDKEERDKRHGIERDYDIITVSYRGKFKQAVRINAIYQTSVWNAIKSFFKTPISMLGTKTITYNIAYMTTETVVDEDSNEKTPV